MNVSRVYKNSSSKGLGLLIFLILFLSLNYHEKTLFFSDSDDQETALSNAFLEKEFPQMKSRKESEELPGWTGVRDSSGNLLAYYTVARENSRHSSGYAGSVPLFIILNHQKIIQEVRFLKNKETRRFIARLDALDFMNSWTGMTLKEAAESQVDTVSGVTLTSRTVIDNLKEVLKDPAMPPVQRVQGYRKIVIPLAEGLLLLFGLFSFFNKNLRKFRTPFLITLIAVFGFAGGDFISLAMLRGYLTGAVPFLGNPILWILLILSLVLPLITNKAFYCSQLCPFGALQELAGKIPFPPRKVPLHLRRYLSSFRTLLFGVLALIIIMDYSLDLSLVEPFAAFLYTVAAPITLVLAMVSLVLSLFYRKPWCRWFCPTGQFLEYLRSDQ